MVGLWPAVQYWITYRFKHRIRCRVVFKGTYRIMPPIMPKETNKVIYRIIPRRLYGRTTQGNINQNYQLYFYDALIMQHCRAFNMLWIIKSKVNLDKLKAYRAMVSEMSEEQKVLLPARSCMLAVTL